MLISLTTWTISILSVYIVFKITDLIEMLRNDITYRKSVLRIVSPNVTFFNFEYTMHESRWLVKLSTCQLAVSFVLCPHGRATMLPPDAACIIQCTRKAIAGLPKSTLPSPLCYLYLAATAFYILLGKVRRNALMALKPKDQMNGRDITLAPSR